MKATLIADLFDPSARTAEGPPRLVDEAIHVEERAYVASAVPKRRAEFGTARLLARAALADLGVTAGPLVPRRDRSPVWPAGIVGSISHTNDYCAVVVNRADRCRAVGLDVESLRAFDPSIEGRVLTPRERAFVDGEPPSARGELTLLFFSAKEAYYKCQHALTGAFLDFVDVELEVALAEGVFVAHVVKPGWPADVAELRGRFAFRDGKVLCGVELSPSPERGR